MLIHGSCHCGNIAFELTWPTEAETIPARACSCAFCVKHAAVWTAHPQASLRVSVTDPSAVSPYVFETRTATFHVCALCGAVPVCSSLWQGSRYAVVNVNAFDNLDRARLVISAVNFDGEDERTRLARRAANWIGSVFVDMPG